MFLEVLSASLIGMGAVAWIGGVRIQPWQLIIIGIVSAILTASTWYMGNRYEELVMRRKRRS